ncbi:MAG: PD-(D/E)XK nuclease family protein [Rikenellaceae bacterium]
METFLEEVAKYLYSQHGDQISELKIIFPSRRARLFFVDALSRIAQRPVWQPRWVSIDDLMSRAAGVEVGDSVRLIAELYKIYSQHHNESFDKFYFWGEILLADFDMIDKYLIDADMLFRNLYDIKELETDISYLTPEQLKIVAFWSSLGEEEDLSEEKRRFLKIWSSLAPIYHQFHDRLEELGVAYTGMIHRRAVARLQSGEYSFEGSGQYIMVGFNALSECEKRLFAELKNSNSAQMFWDYDDYYRLNKEQEAGLFIRENIDRFPSPVEISHNHMNSPKEIEVVGAASNILQCKYVSNIIEQIQSSGEVIDKNTAIVLTNENLLLPLLYSLPTSIGKVNVTMGYPLRESLAYSFLERLIELQHHSRRKKSGGVQFYHVDVVGLLSHPYVSHHDPKLVEQLRDEITQKRMISVDADFLSREGVLSGIFVGCEGWCDMSQYLAKVVSAVGELPYVGDDQRQRDEFLTFILSHIVTLQNSINECDIEMSIPIYISLLRRHLQNLRLPFEGEPLEGVQVMGILETRNLDFRNVIILSMTDDNFPGNHMSQPSFVPYNLRSAYGLPTPEHHEGVYAYYFYRLMQRAQNVWLMYSSHADDKSTGEASRYIYQLDYESPFKLKRCAVGVDVNMIDSQTIEVAKEGRVAERLSRFTDPDNPITLSPTALYRYIACPLRFYFYSVAGIKRDDELSEGVDAPMFGTIFHGAVQELYGELVGVEDFKTPLRKTIEGGRLEKMVDRAINENYLQKREARSDDYPGNILLIKEIVCKYIRDGVVAYDLASPRDFMIQGVECTAQYDFGLEDGRRVRFKGTLDRLDRMGDGSLRVVDYKTGSAHLDFKGVESLFRGDGKERMSNIIQTLLYSMMLYRSGKGGGRVTPALFYVRAINNSGYSPHIVECVGRERREVLSYSECSEEFEGYIKETLAELLDPEIPFKQCEDVKNTCSYCDYRAICKR